MEKLLEALKSLIPADQLEEVAKAVEDVLANSKKELEEQYNEKLKEAYAELQKEMDEAEQTAEKGYAQAYSIIEDLNNRITIQKEEFEKKMEEEFEVAYSKIQEEKSKNETLERELYDEFNKKLDEMKNFMIEKVDNYLEFVSGTMFEEAKSYVLNDPNLVEHKVALDKIIEVAANYLSDEDYAAITSSKIEEANRKINDLAGQVRILESKNLNLSRENNKLNESVRETKKMLVEHTDKNESKNDEKASGRGTRKNADDSVSVIKEWNNGESKGDKNSKEVFTEADDALRQMRILAGLEKE